MKKLPFSPENKAIGDAAKARREAKQAKENVISLVDGPTLHAIKEHGLYQGRSHGDTHKVTCPRWHEHPGEDISGSLYESGTPDGEVPEGFFCGHPTCDGFGIADLKQHLGIVDQVVDPFAWEEDYMISDEMMDKIADPEWAYQNLAIEGHVVAIVAPPNGGKTTIMLQVAADMAANGYNVTYVNADTSGGDAKPMYEFAKQHGFKMIFPDMKHGKSMSDVVKDLTRTSESGVDCRKKVYVLDTLKKMTNVINKSEAKELYKTFRSLSAQGVTSILLGHTNKYKDESGSYVFEGTGDLRSDVDELIYFEPSKDEATKTMTVSTRADKVRGTFEPITFKIDADRRVTRTGYIDVSEDIKRKKAYAKDKDAIECILEVLQGGQAIVQNDIIKAMTADYGVNHKVTRRVLSAYCDEDGYRQHWEKLVGFAKNAVKFRRIKSRVISEDFTSVEGDNP